MLINRSVQEKKSKRREREREKRKKEGGRTVKKLTALKNEPGLDR